MHLAGFCGNHGVRVVPWPPPHGLDVLPLGLGLGRQLLLQGGFNVDADLEGVPGPRRELDLDQ